MMGRAFHLRCWQTATFCVVVAAIILRVRAFSPLDISHPDELMQYLEQGNRIATGHGIVPWEVRYGARNQIIPQLLSMPLWLGHALWPGTLAAMLLARGCCAVLCGGLTCVAAWRIGRLAGRVPSLLALLVVAVWWESVLFSDLLLSESLSTALLLMAVPALLDERATPRGLAIAGLWLGLAVLVRFQYALFGGVLVVAALRLDWARWRMVLMGGLAALAIGALSDLAAGHAPYGWVIENFTMNVGAQNRAARFGASPPLEYARLMLAHMGPAAVFIVAGAVFSGARYRPLLWAALVNLIAHSLIAHKEYRFIWVSEATLLILAGIASAGLANVLARQRGKAAGGPWQIGIVAAGWLVLAIAAERTSGGAATMRGGGAIPRLGVAAAEGGSCGIAIPDQWRAHLVPALLPREVPLSVAPASVMASGDPLPGGIADAASALIFPELPKGATGYHQVRCTPMPVKQACLYMRAGACVPAPGWSYQRALEREDL